MKKGSLLNNKGLTLLEVILVFSLLLVISGLLIFPITNMIRNYQEGLDKSALFEEAQTIESKLVQVVRNTTKIPANSSNTNLYLKINTNGFSFFSAANNQETYFFTLDGKKLFYNSVLLSENVDNFTLVEEGDSVKKLRYTIILSKYSKKGNKIQIKFENRYIYFPRWVD
jgi:competence protein ComGC